MSYAESQYVIDELTTKINSTGWRLQPPTNVTVTNFDEAVKITWTDPEDVTVSGAIAAVWKGTVVVRKVGSAPTSQTDGEVVYNSTTRNAHQTIPYVDSGLTNGTTYYYGIFPYTDLMQYNTTYVTSFTPTAIQVIAPVITNVKAEDQSVTITFTSETPDSLLKIVYKQGSAPTSETDGTIITDISESPVLITPLTNDQTYYFVAYAYTNKRVSPPSEVVSAMPRAYIAYAMHINGRESNPDNMITYPSGYDNSNFTNPASVNLSTGVFNWGDWENAFFIPRSCMLNYDGTVAYYLNENDETKKEDGTASDVTNMSFAGNAMMEWGQNGYILYWKIVPDADGMGETFIIATAQLDDDMKPWNHINCKGQVADHFYTPKYFGSSDGTRMRSMSGGANYVNNTAQSELNLAKANNQTADELWNTEVYADWQLISHLLMMMSKSTNTQAKYGYGRCSSSNSSAIGQGTMNKKGMFWGSSDQTSGVKVFGMENWWGNLWRRIAGYINANGTIKVKMAYGRQDGSTTDKYNMDGTGYVSMGAVAGSSGGYISAMTYNQLGAVPKTISGSDSTYFTDGCYFNNSQNNYAFVGGGWGDGLLVGAFYSFLNAAASSASSNRGAALSCKPLK
ncbi:MAG: hypothetical protein ACK5L6_13510 [Anaerorhabdus sp.]|uniref:hypothetical protein n=1 Tax=Anaerorhabdus sp. TaxID=1872524 RepID=UPI003A877390